MRRADLAAAAGVLAATMAPAAAIAWDADRPINHPHGASGGGRAVVIQAAIAAAGPYWAAKPSFPAEGEQRPKVTASAAGALRSTPSRLV